MDFLSAPREELIRLVYDLVDQNKALKAQIAELKGRMGNPLSKEKNSVPSFVKPSVKKKIAVKHKERGIGFGRVKSPPTKQVFHSLDNCPKCNGVLGAPSVAYTREIIDTPLPQMEVTEHVVFKRWCTNCGQRFTPKVNLGTDIVVWHQSHFSCLSSSGRISPTTGENPKLPETGLWIDSL